MILTVTANSALDEVIFIDEFRPTGVMRTQRVVDSVGGKGLDVSVALGSLGVSDSLAVGIVAGETGERLVRLLEHYGVRHDLLRVAGETRSAHVIVETSLHRHSHIITGGYRLSPADAEAFQDLCRRHLPGASWVVCAGSLPEGMPAGFYEQVTAMAREAGALTLVDCTGEPLRRAAAARPAILKMNQHELAQTFGLAVDALPALLAGVGDLRRRLQLANVVITGGEEGMLAVTEGGCYLARAPRQEAINAAGAGDGASAALVWRLSQGETWPQALHWAAATSAAVVLTEATAHCRMEDVLRIYPQVSVRRIA